MQLVHLLICEVLAVIKKKSLIQTLKMVKLMMFCKTVSQTVTLASGGIIIIELLMLYLFYPH